VWGCTRTDPLARCTAVAGQDLPFCFCDESSSGSELEESSEEEAASPCAGAESPAGLQQDSARAAQHASQLRELEHLELNQAAAALTVKVEKACKGAQAQEALASMVQRSSAPVCFCLCLSGSGLRSPCSFPTSSCAQSEAEAQAREAHEQADEQADPAVQSAAREPAVPAPISPVKAAAWRKPRDGQPKPVLRQATLTQSSMGAHFVRLAARADSLRLQEGGARGNVFVKPKGAARSAKVATAMAGQVLAAGQSTLAGGAQQQLLVSKPAVVQPPVAQELLDPAPGNLLVLPDPPLPMVAAASTSSELAAPAPKAEKPRRNPRRKGTKRVRFAEESHVLEMAEQTDRKAAKERKVAARAAWLRGSPRGATGDVFAWWARWTSLYLLSDEQEAKQDELHEQRYLRLQHKQEQEQAVMSLSKDVQVACWETTWKASWRSGGDSDEDPLPYSDAEAAPVTKTGSVKRLRRDEDAAGWLRRSQRKK